MRIAIVGGGLAGALLAYRLSEASRRVSVEVFTSATAVADATAASGGLVRGFESAPEPCRLAAQSLAELRDSAMLRRWSGYRPTGSIYLLPPGSDPSGPVRTVDRLLPGSVTVATAAELARRHPFRNLPDGSVAVLERAGGHLQPALLRAAALDRVAAGGAAVRAGPVAALTGGPGIRLADGTVTGYDAVVVAAGPWTPDLLARSGLPAGGLRTKQIQYAVLGTAPRGLGAFVDDVSGLYGRPVESGALLLGLPSDRWQVRPADVRPDRALTARVVAVARRRLGRSAVAGPGVRTVAACDCYHDPPGLTLRATGRPGVSTFTGGSGGAAKSVLAASREAAAELLAPPTGVWR